VEAPFGKLVLLHPVFLPPVIMLENHGSGHGKEMSVNNMSKVPIDVIGGLISIIIGLLFTIFHKQLAHKTANFYFRLMHFQFGEKGYKIGFLLSGLAFILFGFLTVLQIIRFRS